MKFSRGMVRAWFDVDIHDDVDRVVDELNLVPGVTAFYGDAGVLLVDSFIEEHSNFKCSIDSFGNQIIVSAKGFEAEYVIDVFDKAVEEIKNTELKQEATPLYTSIKFLVDAPIKSIEDFVAETALRVDNIDAFNIGHKVTVSSPVFDDKYLTEYAGKYFDIV